MKRFGRADIFGLTFVMVILLAATVGMRISQSRMDAVLHKEAVPLRRPLREIPTRLGQWERVGLDENLSAEIVEELGTDQYLIRKYAINGDFANGQMEAHIAYYTGMIDAVPHIPDRCFVGGGLQKSPGSSLVSLGIETDLWEPDPQSASHDYRLARTKYGEFVRMPRLGADEDIRLNTSEYWNPERPEHRFAAGYLFLANGGVTAKTRDVRTLAFKLTDQFAYYCKVQLTFIHPSDSVDREVMGELGGDFLGHLLPEIMRCLPDWYEVELESASGSVGPDGP